MVYLFHREISQNIAFMMTPIGKRFRKTDFTKGESMGNVPRLHRPSQNLLKLSGFVEFDELIILV